MNRPGLIRCMMLVLLLGAGFWAAAEAFVLPGPYVLEEMSRRFRGGRRLKVEQRVQFKPLQHSQGGSVFQETLYYGFPAKFRAELQTPNGSRVLICEAGTCRRRDDAGLQGVGQGSEDRYVDVLLLQSRNHLEQRLTRNGVDVDTTSLGRLEGRIVVVIGAQYPDFFRPQLWIDKETFLPLRWFLPLEGNAENADAFLEVRYQNWRKFDPCWYPRRIVFYREGLPLRTVEVQSVDPRAVFPEDIFESSGSKPRHIETEEPNAPPLARAIKRWQ